jgi:hypothetical protein
MKSWNRAGLFLILMVIFTMVLALCSKIMPDIIYGWKIVLCFVIFAMGSGMLIIGKDD